MKTRDLRVDLGQLILTLGFLVLLFQGTSVLAAKGNALNGEKLFSGAVTMTNGGAPCIACHAVAGLDVAGDASYGPNLSGFYANFGAEGVEEVLESLPFPSMTPIFAKRPLTKVERRDLSAFFAKSTKQQPRPTIALASLILLGVVIVFAIVALLGLRRFKGARLPLVEQARKQRGGMQ